MSDTEGEEIDEYLAEPASEEIFSGPVSESVPSAYSSFRHRRYSSRPPGSRRDSSVTRPSFDPDNDLSSSVNSRRSSLYNRSFFPSSSNNDAVSIHSVDSDTSIHRARAESFSAPAFRFFSQDEIEQAEGASTAPNEVDPVEYEVLRRETEEYMPEEEIPDFISATPHQHPYRYSYEESEFLLRQQEELEHAREIYEEEREEREEAIDGHQDESSRHHHYRKSIDSRRWSETEDAEEPLLSRITSRISQEPLPRPFTASKTYQQRFYISEEDMVIFIAGYCSSKLRAWLYYLLCICTFGLAFLILRWIPRWHVACLGIPAPLGQCDWVVVENQWGEISIINVKSKFFNNPLSQVFRKKTEDDGETDENADSTGNSSRSSFQNHSIQNYHDDESDPDPKLHTLRIIEYRYIKFYYNPEEDIFLTNYDWVDSSWKDIDQVRMGIDPDIQKTRLTVFGPNLIDIEEKSTFSLLIDEVLHPFYVFQVFSMILWSLDEYYYYATCIFIISVISVGNTLVETKQTMKRLRELARFVSDIRVLRSGYWITIPSTELIPGDIYEVSDPSITVFPCDSILLSGDCVVNESMLTGESVPVSKYPASNSALDEYVNGPSQGSSISAEISKHFLYSGTKVVQVRKPVGISSHGDSNELDIAVAMVVRTGFMTTKGSLVRSMLFPKPSDFKFYQDSFKYIGVMALVAVLGFSISIVDFIKMHMSKKLIIFRALDIITIVVPPALPATLTIGTNISLSRLRKKKIFCISPSRVNVGGKLDIICFDKTGTLTEDGLDVLGIHALDSKGEFTPLLQTIEQVFPYENLDLSVDGKKATDIQQRSKMISALTTCHLLRKIDGELLGDPLDHKMFSFTDWNFDEDEGSKKFSKDYTHEYPIPLTFPTATLSQFRSPVNTLGTIKSFDFVPKLRRMSVLVKGLSSEGHNEPRSNISVYVKGAPEIMPEVCDESTFPPNYAELLHYYTHRGYRVIACATKTYDNSMTANEARALSRNEVESGLQFLGFIVFENRLKPSTTEAINQLNNAQIRTVMCTGDNVLTAISVAKECHIVNENNHVFVPRFEELPEGVPFEEFNPIRWEDIDNRNIQLDPYTLAPDSRDGIFDSSQYVLAVTGDAFRYIVQFGSDKQLEEVLMKGAIFARMSPDEKHELVEKLQSLDYTTGFCGDGANDVGALKAAHVGISLSEAEASVAAPFTSQVFEISCVLDVIKEGRSALVTSFSCFKYMSLYSAIQFVTVSILYSLGSNLGDFQFLWIDLFLILPIAIVMAWCEPFPVLCVKRPTANLVSTKILVPLLGQIAILASFQITIWKLVRKVPYYTPPIMGGDDSHVDSTDNTALFIFSCFQYIFISLLLTVGPPYHAPVSKNIPFVVTLIVSSLLTLGFMFVPPDSWVGRLMNLTQLDWKFNTFMVCAIVVNFFVSKIANDYIFSTLAVWMRRFAIAFNLPAKTCSSKLYKRILESEKLPKEA